MRRLSDGCQYQTIEECPAADGSLETPPARCHWTATRLCNLCKHWPLYILAVLQVNLLTAELFAFYHYLLCIFFMWTDNLYF